MKNGCFIFFKCRNCDAEWLDVVKSVFSLSWSWLLNFKSDICTKVVIIIIQINFSGSIQNHLIKNCESLAYLH